MKVSEKRYRAMPPELQALFAKLPNPGSDDVTKLFPRDAGASAPVLGTEQSVPGKNTYGVYQRKKGIFHGDTGSAARFFQRCPDDDAEDAATRLVYVPKASKRDRDEGCEEIPACKKGEAYGNGLNTATNVDAKLHTKEGMEARPLHRNGHPTVKPTALMRYLVRLVTPPGGLVLDIFCGSGSTGKAALLEGFRFVGLEREGEYVAIARARIEKAAQVAGLTAGHRSPRVSAAGPVPKPDDDADA